MAKLYAKRTEITKEMKPKKDTISFLLKLENSNTATTGTKKSKYLSLFMG